MDDLNLYVVADYVGYVRFLKSTSDHRWKEIYYQELNAPILSLGYDSINKFLYMSSWETVFQIEIDSSQLTALPAVTLCKTVMPNGNVNNSDCD